MWNVTRTRLNRYGKARAAQAGAFGFALFLLLGGVSACTNSKSGRNATTTTGTTTTSTTSDSFKISNVTKSGTGSIPTMNVFLDTSQSTAAASAHCNSVTATSTATSKPCVCRFAWQEVNTVSGTGVAISRSVKTKVAAVQSNLVTCPAPEVFNDEIADGTVIKVSIAADSGNPDSFTSSTFNFTKNIATPGSFQDSQGHSFDNILRYSCYEQSKRGMAIQSKIVKNSNPGNPADHNGDMPLASQFCVRKANAASGSAGDGCEGLAAPENSAQANYFNLFIRDSESGDINQGNQRFTCPRVKESLINNGTVGTQGQFWPLDTSFALALGASGEFSVGVEAFTKVSNGDASQKNIGCFDKGSGTAAQPNSLISSCLGFAAKPNSDGTCPSFRNAANQIVPMFRLRRFVTLQPQVFDTDGTLIDGQGQHVDTVYVLDRPVNSGDPLKPYTMRGPKPCPYAYFDSKGVLPATAAGVGYPELIVGSGVTGLAPRYATTNYSGWTGTNVDGIQLPNFDSQNSCSAVIPLVSPDNSKMTLATVHSSNPVFKKLYIRPTRAWAPHYEEDTSFQACAPQSSVIKDPPLHFAKDPSTGNVSWCAEAYPSQNDNIDGLDKRAGNVATANFMGRVAPFTSHVAKNSASADCVRTTPPSLASGGAFNSQYPAASATACSLTVAGCVLGSGWGRHPTDLCVDVDKTNVPICSDKTCDRTVVTTGLSWPRFPLLGRSTEVESAISADTTYSCMISYDNGGAKSGTKSPTQGCCAANVQVWTGTGAATPAAPNTALNAHLEPDVPCLVPNY